MKNILIVNGHPDPESFNYALAAAYKKGAMASNATISEINIAALNFNPNLRYGYRQRTELEPDLLDALEKIKQAEHIVWVFPVWWYGIPAIMKGFIDRTFLPGITFEYVENSPFPQKLMKGTTSRIILTADTPRWYDWLVMGSPVLNQFKKGTLEFCGIRPVSVTWIAPIRNSTTAFRQKWLARVFDMGKKLQ